MSKASSTPAAAICGPPAPKNRGSRLVVQRLVIRRSESLPHPPDPWRKARTSSAASISPLASPAISMKGLLKLPPKIELIARLVGSLASPLRGLVTVLSGNQSGLVRVLNAVREQKEAAAPNA